MLEDLHLLVPSHLQQSLQQLLIPRPATGIILLTSLLKAGARAELTALGLKLDKGIILRFLIELTCHMLRLFKNQ